MMIFSNVRLPDGKFRTESRVLLPYLKPFTKMVSPGFWEDAFKHKRMLKKENKNFFIGMYYNTKITKTF
jgi:hypothetical protein